MDWAEDIKLSIKKTAAKKGRRAGGQQNLSPQNSAEKEESLDIDIGLSLELNEEDSLKGPPKRRKSGGWADSGNKSGKTRSNKNLFEQERFNSTTITTTTTTTTEHSEDDIPIIQDLDDIQDELLMNEIVEPPSVSINRVVTLEELNSDLLKQSAFSALEDIDLSILTKCLQEEALLEEPDEVWEWEQTFTEVSAEINLDKPTETSENDTEKQDKVEFLTDSLNKVFIY